LLRGFHGAAEQRAGERRYDHCGRRAPFRAQRQREQKTQRHVGNEVEQHIVGGDPARPGFKQENAGFGGDRAPAAEGLQAGIDDDQTVS